MVKASNHIHTTVMQLNSMGVFLVVDEVLVERLGHDLLDFRFLFLNASVTVQDVGETREGPYHK
jgi:hypothetical protein